MKKLFLVVFILGIVLLFSNCASKYTLTVADVEPKLAQLSISHEFGFTDEEGFVEYYQIGDPKFDDFFKTAAKLDGLVILAQGMTQSTTKQLKKYAMSKASDEALKENIIELVGNTPPEEYTTEQSIAVMKLAKQHHKVNKDELKYFAKTSVSLGVGVYALGKGVGEVGNLIADGAKLLKNVKSVKPWLIPAASKGLKGCITNLKGIQKNAPSTLEEMKVLLEGFKALS